MSNASGEDGTHDMFPESWWDAATPIESGDSFQPTPLLEGAYGTDWASFPLQDLYTEQRYDQYHPTATKLLQLHAISDPLGQPPMQADDSTLQPGGNMNSAAALLRELSAHSTTSEEMSLLDYSDASSLHASVPTTTDASSVHTSEFSEDELAEAQAHPSSLCDDFRTDDDVFEPLLSESPTARPDSGPEDHRQEEVDLDPVAPGDVVNLPPHQLEALFARVVAKSAFDGGSHGSYLLLHEKRLALLNLIYSAALAPLLSTPLHTHYTAQMPVQLRSLSFFRRPRIGTEGLRADSERMGLLFALMDHAAMAQLPGVAENMLNVISSSLAAAAPFSLTGGSAQALPADLVSAMEDFLSTSARTILHDAPANPPAGASSLHATVSECLVQLSVATGHLRNVLTAVSLLERLQRIEEYSPRVVPSLSAFALSALEPFLTTTDCLAPPLATEPLSWTTVSGLFPPSSEATAHACAVTENMIVISRGLSLFSLCRQSKAHGFSISSHLPSTAPRLSDPTASVSVAGLVASYRPSTLPTQAGSNQNAPNPLDLSVIWVLYRVRADAAGALSWRVKPVGVGEFGKLVDIAEGAAEVLGCFEHEVNVSELLGVVYGVVPDMGGRRKWRWREGKRKDRMGDNQNVAPATKSAYSGSRFNIIGESVTNRDLTFVLWDPWSRTQVSTLPTTPCPTPAPPPSVLRVWATHGGLAVGTRTGRYDFTKRVSTLSPHESLSGQKPRAESNTDALTSSWPPPGKSNGTPSNQTYSSDLQARIGAPALPQLTVELWFKLARTLGDGELVVLCGFSSFKSEVQITITPHDGSAATVRAGYVLGRGPAACGVLASSALLQWCHVALVYQNACFSVIVNGEALGTSPVCATLPKFTGKPWSLASGLNGYLTEVRVWHVAKTIADIQRDMSTRLTGTEPGLSSYLPLTEGAGQVMIDKLSFCGLTKPVDVSDAWHNDAAVAAVVFNGVIEWSVQDAPPLALALAASSDTECALVILPSRLEIASSTEPVRLYGEGTSTVIMFPESCFTFSSLIKSHAVTGRSFSAGEHQSVLQHACGSTNPVSWYWGTTPHGNACFLTKNTTGTLLPDGTVLFIQDDGSMSTTVVGTPDDSEPPLCEFPTQLLSSAIIGPETDGELAVCHAADLQLQLLHEAVRNVPPEGVSSPAKGNGEVAVVVSDRRNAGGSAARRASSALLRACVLSVDAVKARDRLGFDIPFATDVNQSTFLMLGRVSQRCDDLTLYAYFRMAQVNVTVLHRARVLPASVGLTGDMSCQLAGLVTAAEKVLDTQTPSAGEKKRFGGLIRLAAAEFLCAYAACVWKPSVPEKVASVVQGLPPRTRKKRPADTQKQQRQHQQQDRQQQQQQNEARDVCLSSCDVKLVGVLLSLAADPGFGALVREAHAALHDPSRNGGILQLARVLLSAVTPSSECCFALRQASVRALQQLQKHVSSLAVILHRVGAQNRVLHPQAPEPFADRESGTPTFSEQQDPPSSPVPSHAHAAHTQRWQPASCVDDSLRYMKTLFFPFMRDVFSAAVADLKYVKRHPQAKPVILSEVFPVFIGTLPLLNAYAEEFLKGLSPLLSVFVFGASELAPVARSERRLRSGDACKAKTVSFSKEVHAMSRQGDACLTQKVCIPGTTALSVSFDPSWTLNGETLVVHLPGKDAETEGEPFGQDRSWPEEAVTFGTDTLLFLFDPSTGKPDTLQGPRARRQAGFKATVSGTVSVTYPSLHWLHDVVLGVMFASARVCHALTSSYTVACTPIDDLLTPWITELSLEVETCTSPHPFWTEVVENAGVGARLVAGLVKKNHATAQPHLGGPAISRALRAVFAALLCHLGISPQKLAASVDFGDEAPRIAVRLWRKVEGLRHWLLELRQKCNRAADEDDGFVDTTGASDPIDEVTGRALVLLAHPPTREVASSLREAEEHVANQPLLASGADLMRSESAVEVKKLPSSTWRRATDGCVVFHRLRRLLRKSRHAAVGATPERREAAVLLFCQDESITKALFDDFVSRRKLLARRRLSAVACFEKLIFDHAALHTPSGAIGQQPVPSSSGLPSPTPPVRGETFASANPGLVRAFIRSITGHHYLDNLSCCGRTAEIGIQSNVYSIVARLAERLGTDPGQEGQGSEQDLERIDLFLDLMSCAWKGADYGLVLKLDVVATLRRLFGERGSRAGGNTKSNTSNSRGSADNAANAETDAKANTNADANDAEDPASEANKNAGGPTPSKLAPLRAKAWHVLQLLALRAAMETGGVTGAEHSNSFAFGDVSLPVDIERFDQQQRERFDQQQQSLRSGDEQPRRSVVCSETAAEDSEGDGESDGGRGACAHQVQFLKRVMTVAGEELFHGLAELVDAHAKYAALRKRLARLRSRRDEVEHSIRLYRIRAHIAKRSKSTLCGSPYADTTRTLLGHSPALTDAANKQPLPLPPTTTPSRRPTPCQSPHSNHSNAKLHNPPSTPVAAAAAPACPASAPPPPPTTAEQLLKKLKDAMRRDRADLLCLRAAIDEKSSFAASWVALATALVSASPSVVMELVTECNVLLAAMQLLTSFDPRGNALVSRTCFALFRVTLPYISSQRADDAAHFARAAHYFCRKQPGESSLADEIAARSNSGGRPDLPPGTTTCALFVEFAAQHGPPVLHQRRQVVQGFSNFDLELATSRLLRVLMQQAAWEEAVLTTAVHVISACGECWLRRDTGPAGEEEDEEEGETDTPRDAPNVSSIDNNGKGQPVCSAATDGHEAGAVERETDVASVTEDVDPFLSIPTFETFAHRSFNPAEPGAPTAPKQPDGDGTNIGGEGKASGEQVAKTRDVTDDDLQLFRAVKTANGEEVTEEDVNRYRAFKSSAAARRRNAVTHVGNASAKPTEPQHPAKSSVPDAHGDQNTSDETGNASNQAPAQPAGEKPDPGPRLKRASASGRERSVCTAEEKPLDDSDNAFCGGSAGAEERHGRNSAGRSHTQQKTRSKDASEGEENTDTDEESSESDRDARRKARRIQRRKSRIQRCRQGSGEEANGYNNGSVAADGGLLPVRSKDSDLAKERQLSIALTVLGGGDVRVQEGRLATCRLRRGAKQRVFVQRLSGTVATVVPLTAKGLYLAANNIRSTAHPFVDVTHNPPREVQSDRVVVSGNDMLSVSSEVKSPAIPGRTLSVFSNLLVQMLEPCASMEAMYSHRPPADPNSEPLVRLPTLKLSQLKSRLSNSKTLPSLLRALHSGLCGTNGVEAASVLTSGVGVLLLRLCSLRIEMAPPLPFQHLGEMCALMNWVLPHRSVGKRKKDPCEDDMSDRDEYEEDENCNDDDDEEEDEADDCDDEPCMEGEEEDAFHATDDTSLRDGCCYPGRDHDEELDQEDELASLPEVATEYNFATFQEGTDEGDDDIWDSYTEGNANDTDEEEAYIVFKRAESLRRLCTDPDLFSDVWKHNVSLACTFSARCILQLLSLTAVALDTKHLHQTSHNSATSPIPPISNPAQEASPRTNTVRKNDTDISTRETAQDDDNSDVPDCKEVSAVNNNPADDPARNGGKLAAAAVQDLWTEAAVGPPLLVLKFVAKAAAMAHRGLVEQESVNGAIGTLLRCYERRVELAELFVAQALLLLSDEYVGCQENNFHLGILLVEAVAASSLHQAAIRWKTLSDLIALAHACVGSRRRQVLYLIANLLHLTAETEPPNIKSSPDTSRTLTTERLEGTESGVTAKAHPPPSSPDGWRRRVDVVKLDSRFGSLLGCYRKQLVQELTAKAGGFDNLSMYLQALAAALQGRNDLARAQRGPAGPGTPFGGKALPEEEAAHAAVDRLTLFFDRIAGGFASSGPDDAVSVPAALLHDAHMDELPSTWVRFGGPVAECVALGAGMTIRGVWHDSFALEPLNPDLPGNSNPADSSPAGAQTHTATDFPQPAGYCPAPAFPRGSPVFPSAPPPAGEAQNASHFLGNVLGCKPSGPASFGDASRGVGSETGATALLLASACAKVRAESFSNFATVLANVSVGTGQWYYEVEVEASTLLQVGWVDAQNFACDSEEGHGVGDDRYSWSYDGTRCCIWHAKTSKPYATQSDTLDSRSRSNDDGKRRRTAERRKRRRQKARRKRRQQSGGLYSASNNNTTVSSCATTTGNQPSSCCGDTLKEANTSHDTLCDELEPEEGSTEGDWAGDDAGLLSEDHDEIDAYDDDHASFGASGWRAGDVIGCLLDVPAGDAGATIRFTLNGTDLGTAFSGVKIANATRSLSPAASLRSGDVIGLNLGAAPFKHAPNGYRGVAASVAWLHGVLHSGAKHSETDELSKRALVDVAGGYADAWYKAVVHSTLDPSSSDDRRRAQPFEVDDATMCINTGKILHDINRGKPSCNSGEDRVAEEDPSRTTGDQPEKTAGDQAPHSRERAGGWYLSVLCRISVVARLVRPFVGPEHALPNWLGSCGAMRGRHRSWLGKFVELKDVLLPWAKEPLIEGVVSGSTSESHVASIFLSRNYFSQNLAKSGQTETLFDQLHALYRHKRSWAFRSHESCDSSARLWTVVFEGEAAEDAGGPFRESLTTVCEELSEETPSSLFIASPNQKGNFGDTRDKLVARPALASTADATPQAIVEHELLLSKFRFLGRLMAGCLSINEPMDLSLSSLVWKTLTRTPCDRSDLASVDQMCLNALDGIVNIDKKGVTPELFRDAIDECFVTTLSDGQEVELVKNGRDVEVTFQTREAYARLVIEKRLRESEVYLEEMRKGFADVLPESVLDLFTWKELERRVCGASGISVPELQKLAIYEDIDEQSTTVQYFWAAVETFSDPDLTNLLRFVAARSRLPVAMKVQSFAVDGNPDHYLPQAHTCFFSIELPAYSSVDIMRHRLLYAIYNCRAIDTDGTPVGLDDMDADDEEEFEFDDEHTSAGEL
ncbi:putative E3 ubiquitin-protein ligase HERC2 [Diplonema papillatum]|nr:putative E3 ubiquitin-protein ligase HERC2 [Diplonema papillatum]|eukprot:gene20172-31015_t